MGPSFEVVSLRMHRFVFGSFAFVALAAFAAEGGGNGTRGAEVRENVIVPCLLPARVRKLGGIVYPERRKLTQTTAKNCELRGGEYTAYDRARPESAVAFFTPLADQGDPTAQTSLGEVYEYLFEPPRFQDAATWYQKAMDQGDLTAVRRLAHLYELGLGVEKDPLLATNLWRRALGTNDDFVLASTLEKAQSAADQRVSELTTALRARNAEADALAQSLAAAQTTLSNQKASLKSAEASIALLQRDLATARASSNAADPARVAQLEKDLADNQRKLDDQRYQVQSREIELGSQKAQLEANLRQAGLENDRLKQELVKTTALSDADQKKAEALLASRSEAIATLKAQQAELVRQLSDQRTRFDAVVAELAQAQAGAATSNEAVLRAQALETQRQQQATALAQSEAKAKGMERQLAAAETEAKDLRASLDAAVNDRARLEAQLATIEAGLVSTQSRLAATEANLEATRSELAAATRERDLLAAKSASEPAIRAQVAERETRIKTLSDQIDVLIAQTKKLNAENDLLKEQRAQQLATRDFRDDPLPDTSRIKLPEGVDLGKSYALVIGNNTYRNLRQLNFAENDARRVYETLTSGYGYKAELLTDATAADIFKRFDELVAQLKPNDSLVIYFAGHGAQDSGLSYWLGIDATADKSSWRMAGVSTYDLNKWLDVIEAKHVLVVADSCYSGAGIVSIGGIKLKTPDVEKQLEFALGGPSRTVISSGGRDPVPDGGAGDGSVFTKTFVALLNENRGVLTDAEMFAHLKERVQFSNGGAAGGVPTPVFGRIEGGGHVRGQFVFLNPRLQA